MERSWPFNLTGPIALTMAVSPCHEGQGRAASSTSLGKQGSANRSLSPMAVSIGRLIHWTRFMAVALAPEKKKKNARQLRGPGLLDGTRATANLRPEQIERSASGSLLKRQPTMTTGPTWFRHVPHRDHDRPDRRQSTWRSPLGRRA